MASLPSFDNPKHCLNCSFGLTAEAQYCAHCGQRVRETPLPVREFLSDFLQDYFTVDSKFFRSVRLLLWKPGMMTSAFNAGKRVSFIAPFRFYIFVSVAYFFLLAFTTRDSNINFFKSDDAHPEVQLQKIDSLIADTALYADRDKLLEQISRIRRADQSPLDSIIATPSSIQIGLDSLQLTGTANLSGALGKRWQRIKENPMLYKQAILKAASIGAFFLLPLFALLLKILLRRSSKFYVNHLVFSVHFHTCMFFLFSLYLIVGAWSVTIRHWLLFILTLLYFGLTIQVIVRDWPNVFWKKLLINVMLIPFALCIYIAFTIDPGENDVVALFILGASYLTLSLINGYSQNFLQAVFKSVIIIPVYLLILLCTLIGVAVTGILLA